MLVPIQLDDGIIFDARGVILVLAPIFGGPFAGLIAGVIGGAGRWWIGGDGALMGVVAVAIATGAGLAYRAWIRRDETAIPSWHFLGLGVGVHAATAVGFLLLLPSGVADRAFANVGSMMIVVNGPATWLLGFIMQVFEAHRRQTQAITTERALLQVNLDRLETVIQSFPGAISVYDSDLRLAVANDETYRLLGYPKELFPPGAHMSDILRYMALQGEYGDVDVEPFVAARIATARSVDSVSAERTRPNGTVIEVRMRAMATGGCVFTHQDITERRRHEAALQRHSAQLQGIRDIESAYIAGAEREQIYDPMLAVVLDLTDSEYGFVGDVVHEPDGTPYLKIWSITNIAWNPEMQRLYEHSIGSGLEFRRLDTLFGAVMTSGAPVIANDPASDHRSGGLPPGHPALDAFLGLPIYAGDTLVGVIGVANRDGGYDEELIEFLQPLSHACGLMMAGLAARSAREHAEAAMKESAARLELAVRAGNIGIWIWDFATDKMYFSPEWKRQIGYEDDEIGDDHREWVDRLHPEDSEQTLATTRKFIADPWPGFGVEFRLRHKDGSYRWILAHGSLSYGNDGKPARMMGTHVDITEHKEAEQAMLRESSRRLLLFDNAPDGIFVLDFQLAVVEANQSFARMLGRPLEDVIGLHPWDWDANYPTPDLLRAAFPEPPLEPTTFITRIRRPDGMVFDVEVNSVVADWAGEGSVFNVCRDVTERMRTEERVRELSIAVEQSPASIVITDTNGLIKYVNPRYEQITGYASAEVLGKVPRILRPGVLPDEDLRALRAAIEAGGDWRGEFQSVRKDGEAYWEMGSVSAIKARDGRVTNYILIREDISRSKAIEAQLRQSQKMEAIGQLTAGMAHDFNNLLAIIIGNLELAVEATGDNVVTDKIGTALRASQRGAALTRQLLAFGRRAPLQPQPTDLNALVADLEPLLHRTLGTDIEVKTALADGIAPIMIDRNQMENALLNLAINARDAMAEGGTLTIETAEVELDAATGFGVAPGIHAMVAVSDTGSGMSPDVLAHAFDPFFTTKSVGKGSGLGLSMVYGFVKQSGGHARIYSEPERGTSVKLYFPLSVRALVADEGAKGREGGEQIAAVGRERILVLENDDDVRETVSAQLRSLGYAVLTEDTGDGALQLIDDGERIDLLLCDVVLGGSDKGPEVAARMRLKRPEMRVIFMSGYPERAASNGQGVSVADKVLQKPIRRADLAHAIRRELGPTQGTGQ